MSSKLDRRTEFKLIDDDTGRKAITECFNIFSKKFGPEAAEKYIDEKTGEVKNWQFFIINSYYLIGMLDYDMAGFQGSIDSTKLIESLKDRAFLSAGLQYFIDNKLSHDQKQYLFDFGTGIDDIEGEEIPSVLYHGRVRSKDEVESGKEISFDMLGKTDDNGVYYTKDGMTYSTYSMKTAEFYASLRIKKDATKKVNDNYPDISDDEIETLINEEIEKQKRIRSQILSYEINDEDKNKFGIIFDTHGGVPFMFQEQIYDLSKEGKIRWLQSCKKVRAKGRADVIDISGFSDFVDERDRRVIGVLENSGLRMPEGVEEFQEYMEFLAGKEREFTERMQSSQNSMSILQGAIKATKGVTTTQIQNAVYRAASAYKDMNKSNIEQNNDKPERGE